MSPLSRRAEYEMRDFSEREINDFQQLLLKSEIHKAIKEISFTKWFSLEAFGKYKSDLIIGGRNYGESISVNDVFNCAFRLQNIYSPIADHEKPKAIIYDFQKVAVKIKALEAYGKWLDEISSGLSFQAIIAIEDLRTLNLSFSSFGKEWRLGSDWIDLKYPNYLIGSSPDQIENFEVINY